MPYYFMLQKGDMYLKKKITELKYKNLFWLLFSKTISCSKNKTFNFFSFLVMQNIKKGKKMLNLENKEKI